VPVWVELLVQCSDDLADGLLVIKAFCVLEAGGSILRHMQEEESKMLDNVSSSRGQLGDL